MNTPAQQVIERYIVIDAHKHYVVIGGLSAQMESVLPLRRVHIGPLLAVGRGALQAV
jgi:hypothetical protein